ncbi:hypothetical protein BU23DRAFT_658483 [Bimuria novae-zelandiae CBS 107.79]|uniref:Zn(2)-C6 fungal-type domain-containing protein n=1 Tax=Bimuria novae-zelandiae CBS 107.79 TaxID=1447943 RepID=A0A6A5USI7_9PLEO|nr:hypothetical protein BU23DRAFT_658483 [Bimuria novae-zelandiae CBS 107.79]
MAVSAANLLGLAMICEDVYLNRTAGLGLPRGTFCEYTLAMKALWTVWCKHTSYMDGRQNTRKRAAKACDRCRGKKAKCDGGHACNRCRSDNMLCTYGHEAKDRQPSTSPSYVLALETHIKLLARGIQELYQLLQRGQSLPGGPLQIAEAGQPLIHDILDRLGLLAVTQQHSTFQWDPAIVDRLVHPWEASEPNPLPLRTLAPENFSSNWPSNPLENQLTHNPYHGVYGLETGLDTTALDSALQAASSMDMFAAQDMQDGWIMGLHLG